jgi:hypothetical protein
MRICARLLLSAIMAALLPAAVAAPPVVAPGEAARRVGELVTVEGVVDCVSRAHTSNALYFNFGGGFPKQIFSVKYLLGREGLPYGYFHGRTVRVTGKVFATRTGPQMQVNAAENFYLVPVDEKILTLDPAQLDGRAAREHVMAGWRQVLHRGEFSRLEEAAADFRQRGTRFADGTPALAVLYEAVSQIEAPSPSGWKGHLAILEEWEKAFPGSPTPRIARAAATSSMEREVVLPELLEVPTDPAKAEELMNALFDPKVKAREILERTAASIPGAKADPHWYCAILSASPEEPEAAALFSEAILAHPGYEPLYLARAEGIDGEETDAGWETFAATIRENDPVNGREIYARIAWKMNLQSGGEVFKKNLARWDWTREGFDEMLRRYPRSAWLVTSFARQCWYANDGTTARRLLPRLGNPPDMSVWYGDGYYQDFLFWARQAP